MHRLLDALKRVMEPPVSKKRSLIRRSVPIITKMKPPPYLPKPTDEEIQYLTFFTDYCRLRDDFVTYRSKFPDDFNLTFQSKRDDIEIKTIFDDTSSSREQKQEKEEEEKVEEKRKWIYHWKRNRISTFIWKFFVRIYPKGFYQSNALRIVDYLALLIINMYT